MMKKSLLLMAAFLMIGIATVNARQVETRKTADLSQAKYAGSADNGSWTFDVTAGTGVFTWTAGNNARVIFPDLVGDLTGYTKLVVETADYTKAYRIGVVANGSDKMSGSLYSAGTKEYSLADLTTEEIANITEVRVNCSSNGSPSAEAPGTVTIKAVYFVKTEDVDPFALNFNVAGVCNVDFNYLVATGVTFDPATGAVSSPASGTRTLALDLPAEGIDMSEVDKITVTYEGDNIINRLLVYDAANTKVFDAYSSKFNLSFASPNAGADLTKINKIYWNFNAEGSGTIKAITITKKKTPFALNFDANGACNVGFEYLVANANVTFDAETGAITTTDSGTRTLSIDLPAEGIDMSEVGRIKMDFEGDDMVNTLTVTDVNGVQLFQAYSSKFDLDFTGELKNAEADRTKVKSIVWSFKNTAEGTPGTGTVKSVTILSKTATGINTIRAAKGMGDGAFYNLNGMRVQNPTKGVYIQNGKKVVIK